MRIALQWAKIRGGEYWKNGAAQKCMKTKGAKIKGVQKLKGIRYKTFLPNKGKPKALTGYPQMT